MHLFAQDIGHAHGGYEPLQGVNVPGAILVGGFQVITSGRFWGLSALLVKAVRSGPFVILGDREETVFI